MKGGEIQMKDANIRRESEGTRVRRVPSHRSMGRANVALIDRVSGRARELVEYAHRP